MVQQQHLIPECADRPGDDPIFALNAEANRRIAAGEDVLNSTLGALMNDDLSMAIMPSVFEAMERVPREKAAAYAPISGPPLYLDALRRDLFGDSALHALSVAAATPGGTGACHHAIVNFLDPGDTLLTGSYYWGPYGILAKHTRRNLDTFNMFREDGSFDVTSLETKVAELLQRQGRVLLFLNTPCHNPTGYSMRDDDWAAVVGILAAAAEQGPVTLLLDFAYEKFARPGSIMWPTHVESLLGKVPVLFAWTASKAFCQYGARIGACIALVEGDAERNAIKNALGYSCRGTWSNCNHLGMLAVGEVLSDPGLRSKADAERDALRGLLDERVEIFNRLAGEHDLAYPDYEGGFFVSVFTPDAARTVESMQQEGVFVVPLNGAVRVALCSTPGDQIERLVDSLARGVQTARGQAVVE